MSPNTIAILGVVVLVLLFLVRMPVAYAMGIVGFVGFGLTSSWDAALSIVAKDIWATFSSYSLSVAPMFILMGTIAFHSGISARLFNAAHKWSGRLPGGLAIATVLACAGFGAMCGSTTAAAAAMGKVTLPEMKRYGYDDALRTGSVASAGSLAVMIPPSTILIIYGVMTQESIGQTVHRRHHSRASSDGPVFRRYHSSGKAEAFVSAYVPDVYLDGEAQVSVGRYRDADTVRPGHGRALRRLVHSYGGRRHRRLWGSRDLGGQKVDKSEGSVVRARRDDAHIGHGLPHYLWCHHIRAFHGDNQGPVRAVGVGGPTAVAAPGRHAVHHVHLSHRGLFHGFVGPHHPDDSRSCSPSSWLWDTTPCGSES